jgi:hypothetical protein
MCPSVPETFYTSERSAWREYLAAHFETGGEVWFVFPVKQSGEESLSYNDAVEEALCFGWIDSTMKRIDDGKPVQHFTPRRRGSNWCEQNLVRCRRLVRLGEMTPYGLKAAPDLNPEQFVYEDWVIDAIRADSPAWKHFRAFPENYRRIKVDRIQHYHKTARGDYAKRLLDKFIRDCHDGKIQNGWSDFGRLADEDN